MLILYFLFLCLGMEAYPLPSNILTFYYNANQIMFSKNNEFLTSQSVGTFLYKFKVNKSTIGKFNSYSPRIIIFRNM